MSKTWSSSQGTWSPMEEIGLVSISNDARQNMIPGEGAKCQRGIRERRANPGSGPLEGWDYMRPAGS